MAVEAQFRAAQWYRNRLIEITNKSREKYQQLMLRIPEIARLQETIDADKALKESLREEIKVASAKARKNVPLRPGLREQIASLTKAIKENALTLRAAKDKAKAQIAEETNALYAETAAEQKALYNEAGQPGEIVHRKEGHPDIREPRVPLAWGTRLLMNKAHEQACSTGMPLKVRHDPVGRIGVQLQKGRTISQIFSGKDGFLRIEPVPDDTWDPRPQNAPKKGERLTREQHKARKGTGGKTKSRTRVHLNIGEGRGEDRPFATFPITLYNRKLPVDGKVLWAWILRERIGTRMEYKLQLSVESNTFKCESDGHGAIAFDIGWRVRSKNNLRIAYWFDDYGQSGEILLPEIIPSGLAKADSLQAIRKRKFNRMRALLSKAKADAIKTGMAIPPALLTETETLSAWRSEDRLRRLVKHIWPNHRFAGDERWFNIAKNWLHKELHLYQWECDERQQAIARRTNFYRHTALEFARKYQTCVFENFKLTRIAVKEPVESEKADTPSNIQHNRVVSALSDFRDAFKNKMIFAKVPMEFTTIVCHNCRHPEKFNAAKELIRTCPKCNTTWDQDLNAAKNILSRFHCEGTSGTDMGVQAA